MKYSTKFFAFIIIILCLCILHSCGEGITRSDKEIVLSYLNLPDSSQAIEEQIRSLTSNDLIFDGLKNDWNNQQLNFEFVKILKPKCRIDSVWQEGGWVRAIVYETDLLYENLGCKHGFLISYTFEVRENRIVKIDTEILDDEHTKDNCVDQYRLSLKAYTNWLDEQGLSIETDEFSDNKGAQILIENLDAYQNRLR